MQLLDDALIDQIAAGEVVERPASVVKELVENSLDAGALRIRVEVRDGGRSSIVVTDDGWGMEPADARLAVQRHATSKLRSAADLRRIASFGFRGEALPAIASVSRFRLRTRARGGEEGLEIRIEGGRSREERAAGGPEGTRIEVAELFGAVPARRKFLKTAATEWGHVADWMARIALAQPGVHFDLRRDERTAVGWPEVGDPLERIAAVLSEEEAGALVAVDGEGEGLRISGFASRPDHHRPNASGVYLFVNGRPVRDRLLRHALLEHYRDVLPRGRHPSAVLFLEVPAEAVDVNVHPAKWEVRFADPQAVHALVRRALRDAQGARPWLGGAARAGAEARPQPDAAPGRPFEPARARAAGLGVAEGASDWIFAREASATPPAPGAAPVSSGTAEVARSGFAALRLIGQALATYLVVEGKETLLLVDQHAAHERVLYERLRAQWLERGVERQALLVPATLELEPAVAAALVASAPALERLGFEIEPFGETTLAVRAVPALLEGRDPVALIRGLADDVRASEQLGTRFEPGSRALEQADRAFATLACHAARRAGDVLPAPEQRALLEALDSIPWAATCPHGRPVVVPLTLPEIERRFGRR